MSTRTARAYALCEVAVALQRLVSRKACTQYLRGDGVWPCPHRLCENMLAVRCGAEAVLCKRMGGDVWVHAVSFCVDTVTDEVH